MMGMLNSGQPPQGAVPAAGPTPDQPTGLQQPTDVAAPWFQQMAKGLEGLSQALMKLGDQYCSNEVQELKVKLLKIGDQRSRDLLKKMELDNRLGNAQANISGGNEGSQSLQMQQTPTGQY